MDWKDGPDPELRERLETERERRAEERRERLENPDPDEEHRIFGAAVVSVWWYYRVVEEEWLEYEEEERHDERPPEQFHCTCGVYDMDEGEAVAHIQRAQQA